MLAKATAFQETNLRIPHVRKLPVSVQAKFAVWTRGVEGETNGFGLIPRTVRHDNHAAHFSRQVQSTQVLAFENAHSRKAKRYDYRKRHK
jgi:hypothetical protein